MAIKGLLYAGFALLPFVVWQGMEIRTAKEILTLSLAISMILIAIYQGASFRLKNFWFLGSIAWLFYSAFEAPQYPNYLLWYVQDNGQYRQIGSIAGFWIYKAILYCILSLLLMIVVANIKFSLRDIRFAFQVMVVTAFLTSLYMFIQAAGLDQWFGLNPRDPNKGWVTQWAIGGFLGQPTFAAVYLAVVLPVAVYLRWWWAVLALIVALLLTDSQVGQLSLLAGIVPLFLMVKIQKKALITLAMVILLSVGAIYFKHNPEKFSRFKQDSGRVTAWKQIYQDWKKPALAMIGGNRAYTITGTGPGSFFYTFPVKYRNLWTHAHNDYIEMTRNGGLGQLALFLMGVGYMFLYSRSRLIYGPHKRNILLVCQCSTIIFLTSAMGTFSMQLPVMVFYACFFMGLLHNDHLIKEILE